jgi:hypothetical protein
MHVPLLQTAPASHAVPLPALPTGMHVGCPCVLHVTTPVWQGAFEHGSPALQDDPVSLAVESPEPSLPPSFTAPTSPAESSPDPESFGSDASDPACCPSGRSPSRVEQPTAAQATTTKAAARYPRKNARIRRSSSRR